MIDSVWDLACYLTDDTDDCLVIFQGVKMLVFPEYGITGWMDAPKYTRDTVYPFQESISFPYPRNGSCDLNCSVSPWRGSEGHHGAACIAKKYGMYVTANLIEADYCEVLKDHNCPYDNHYLYNTNIVYNPNGCLIAKYRKTHTVEEPQRLNKPLKPEYIYFDTEYGRFGTIICADGIFRDPVVDLVEKYQVDHIIHPMAWANNFTHTWMMSSEWQFALAARYNVSIIAANIHQPKHYYQGSGVFQGQRVLNFTYNDKPQTTLITADLPIPHKPTHHRYPQLYGKIESQQARSGGSALQPDGVVTIYSDEYNVRIVRGLSGVANMCYDNFCCSLNFTRNSTEDFYVLAAFKGLHSRRDIMHLENCVTYKCPSSDLESCSQRQNVSQTSFSHFHLSATFTTDYVYPSVLPSQYAFDKLEWNFERLSMMQNTLTSSSEWPLVAASLVGLVF